VKNGWWWCKIGVSAKPDVEEVIAAIRQAVAEEHEVLWSGLIKPGSIPKTSSGKIQRRAYVQIS